MTINVRGAVVSMNEAFRDFGLGLLVVSVIGFGIYFRRKGWF